MVASRRIVSLLFCLTVAAMAAVLAADVLLADGEHWLDYFRTGLLALSAGWLGWGAAIALNGLISPREANRPARDISATRTAVLVPVYNEDPAKTFSHVAAMARDLAGTGFGDMFDFAVLSDTTDPAIAADEERWIERLRAEITDSTVFYRRRDANTGKKAGNVADFIRSSGAIYDFLIILDADSLVAGRTMVEMVGRMQAEPRLGLLQTLPKIIHARSWFGRATQFAATFYSPTFARGLATLQGEEGPFWGHNAIVRTRAFAQSCGLPALSGRPPFGGHILSHDYVEAALLARNDWIVRLDTDLEGSFEEGPENLIDFAKRDRRWCQGNLQHMRLVGAPGLKLWSRFVFVQGIMAYLASPVWAIFLAATIAAPAIMGEPDYFPNPAMPPVFPRVEHAQALALLTGIVGILIGPKLLILLREALARRTASFGGVAAAALSTIAEVAWSSMLAPLMLMYQTRAVLQVAFGADGGWPAANREAGAVGLREAWDASWWICAAGFAVLAATFDLVPELFYWLLPVTVPMIFSPLIIHLTSRGNRRVNGVLFATPQQSDPDPVIAMQEAVLARWRSAGEANDPSAPDLAGPEMPVARAR